MRLSVFPRAVAVLGGLMLGVFAFLSSPLAADFTLRLHHFNSPRSIAHTKFLVPWARKVEAESGGRIKFQIYPAMQLGGKPGDLYGQARDGVVDLVWTLPGYLPGQFPLTAVFELPFMGENGEAASQALMAFYRKHLTGEFEDVHVIVLHSTDTGFIHAKTPIRRLEDIKGMKLRATSRWIGEAIKALGAVPVGMPIPALPAALSRGQVEGMLLAWSVMRPFRFHEITRNTLEVPIYHTVFALVMNKASYAKLPPDLKAVLDANSGMALAQQLGRIWDQDGDASRTFARMKGSTVVTPSEEEIARWVEASKPAIDGWIAMASGKGHDGAALYREAKSLTENYAP